MPTAAKKSPNLAVREHPPERRPGTRHTYLTQIYRGNASTRSARDLRQGAASVAGLGPQSPIFLGLIEDSNQLMRWYTQTSPSIALTEHIN